MPIANYNRLTVEEVKNELEGFSNDELKKVRSYESSTRTVRPSSSGWTARSWMTLSQAKLASQQQHMSAR